MSQVEIMQNQMGGIEILHNTTLWLQAAYQSLKQVVQKPPNYITPQSIQPDQLKIASLANKYMSAHHQPLTIKQKLEFEKWINKVYLEETKDINVEFVNYQPYKSIANMQEDYRVGKLKISTQGSRSSLTNTLANLKWRAIHDCHHCKSGHDFSFQGELDIWIYVCKEYNLPDWMQGLVFSDLVFQAAATVHNGYFLEGQKNVMSYV